MTLSADRATTDSVPMGLSDLTEDEAMVVMLYRDWQRLGPIHAVAEHAISRLLKTDVLYPLLDALFAVFAIVGDDPASDGDHALLLSCAEEQVLDRVSRSLPSGSAQDSLPAFRPIGAIERSGHDALVTAVNRASWQAASCCHAGVER